MTKKQRNERLDRSIHMGASCCNCVIAYQIPFKFTGKIDKITLTINRPQLSPEDEKKLMEAQRDNRMSE